MHKKDTLDVEASLLAAAGDVCAVIGGVLAATWIRFDSGWLPVIFGRPGELYRDYALGAVVAAALFVYVFRRLGLYDRPQLGTFESKIPRLVRATGIGLLLCVVLAYALKNFVPFATVVLAMSMVTITVLVVLERYILFRVELHYVRHSPVVNRTLILGADEVAAHLKRAVEKEPGLRTRVVGFLRTSDAPPHADIPAEMIKGSLDDFAGFVEAGPDKAVDRVILTTSSLPHERIVDIILLCEQHLITFNMVPDLFRILTGSMGVQAVDGVPLLGVSRWPLDSTWNRAIKRIEDIAGAAVGLVLAAPVIAVAAVMIKRSSPGPVFYSQDRCGENGKLFRLHKLRTMRIDAESRTGPVFTTENDPRTTGIGAFLRQWNLDELPQFWNVLRGEMSLVGPRPERPHFVEKFKQDIGRYMWRHVSKPGLTGWAQVNGLRGNTSIEERIKYDLYYLENWSLSFDFKILLKTFFARQNAY